jgi:hypothetical protein
MVSSDNMALSLDRNDQGGLVMADKQGSRYLLVAVTGARHLSTRRNSCCISSVPSHDHFSVSAVNLWSARLDFDAEDVSKLMP